MTKSITTKLACFGFLALVSATGIVATPAVQQAQAATTFVASVERVANYKKFRMYRIHRFRAFRCHIKRVRIRLPNGRWVIAERKVCPGPLKLAPRR
jgi:hypothetical protein